MFLVCCNLRDLRDLVCRYGSNREKSVHNSQTDRITQGTEGRWRYRQGRFQSGPSYSSIPAAHWQTAIGGCPTDLMSAIVSCPMTAMDRHHRVDCH